MNEMNNRKPDGPEAVRGLRVLFLGMALGVFSFLGVTVFFAYIMEPEVSDPATVKNFVYIALAVLFLSLPAAEWIFRRMKKEIPDDLPLEEKIMRYRKTFVARFAILYLPVMMSVVFLLMTARIFPFAGIIAFMLVVILFTAPTQRTLIKDLNLSREEADLLEKWFKESRDLNKTKNPS